MIVRCVLHQPVWFTNTCACGEEKTLGRSVCATCAVRYEIEQMKRWER